MATSLRAHGIRAELPNGWEGRITQLAPVMPTNAALKSAGALVQTEITRPFAHFANMALPPNTNAFGGGAVEQLGAEHSLICLIEYSPECVGTALFSKHRLPRKLLPWDFNRRGLQRIIPGQAGSQTFLTEAGRPFCLYVVVGSYLRLGTLTRQINSVLRGIHVDSVAAS